MPEEPGPGFEWDAAKADYNPAKHGVSFREAETAFAGEQPLILPDTLHSWDEYREFMVASAAAG